MNQTTKDIRSMKKEVKKITLEEIKRRYEKAPYYISPKDKEILERYKKLSK